MCGGVGWHYSVYPREKLQFSTGMSGRAPPRPDICRVDVRERHSRKQDQPVRRPWGRPTFSSWDLFLFAASKPQGQKLVLSQVPLHLA